MHDEVIKQILIQTDKEDDMTAFCLTNKRFTELYSDVKFMEAVYHQKCENDLRRQ